MSGFQPPSDCACGGVLAGWQADLNGNTSGNAGTGLRSNGQSFGSYYADPETGLLYARARYFDPASGQFVSRDPEEGEANLPITWGAYQYARYSPYRYNDPNGKCDSLSDCASGVTDAIVRAGRAVAEALSAAETKPEQEQRGREIARINRGFRNAREAKDIPAMERYQEEFKQLTADDPTPSMLHVPMSSAIMRARADAQMPASQASVEDAAWAALGAGISGISPSPKGAGPKRPARTQEVKNATTPVTVVENARGLTAEGEMQPQVTSARAASGGDIDSKVKWVDENAGMSSRARDYNDSATGARSNPATKSGQAPALERTMPDESTRLVKFDGVDSNVLVDRKIAVVTTRKSKNQASRQSEALGQNGLTARWEVPDKAQASRAQKMLDDLGIKNISVKVVNEPGNK